MGKTRRNFISNMLGSSALLLASPLLAGIEKRPSGKKLFADSDPTQCNYCPAGEFIKDHSIVFHDGWYHLFSISGIQGYYHGYNGNEETVSWSISRDLVNWEMRGHVLHASQRKGAFDQHEVWAPFCYKAKDQFFMFYTGIIHPHRPMEYKKLGHDHKWVYEGHKETQGLAISNDLTYWDKISDFGNGLGIPGRDSFVTYDDEGKRWLLYSTLGVMKVHLAESKNLTEWNPIGECAEFPELDAGLSHGKTTDDMQINHHHSAESLTVIKNPLSGKWLMLGNWQYMVSDNPLHFEKSTAKEYNRNYNGKQVDMGFACEIIQYNGKWYRSGVIGKRDYWKLGFTEIEWDKDAAFRIVKPSVIVF